MTTRRRDVTVLQNWIHYRPVANFKCLISDAISFCTILTSVMISLLPPQSLATGCIIAISTQRIFIRAHRFSWKWSVSFHPRGERCLYSHSKVLQNESSGKRAALRWRSRLRCNCVMAYDWFWHCGEDLGPPCCCCWVLIIISYLFCSIILGEGALLRQITGRPALAAVQKLFLPHLSV